MRVILGLYFVISVIFLFCFHFVRSPRVEWVNKLCAAIDMPMCFFFNSSPTMSLNLFCLNSLSFAFEHNLLCCVIVFFSQLIQLQLPIFFSGCSQKLEIESFHEIEIPSCCFINLFERHWELNWVISNSMRLVSGNLYTLTSFACCFLGFLLKYRKLWKIQRDLKLVKHEKWLFNVRNFKFQVVFTLLPLPLSMTCEMIR